MKHSRIIMFYVLAAVAVLYARTAQILYLTEGKSGFFFTDSVPVAIALSLFIALAVGVAAFISLLSRRTPKAAPQWNGTLCTASLLLAASFVYEAFFVEYITSAAVFVLLAKLSAGLSAIVMLLYCVQPLYKTKFKFPSIAFICPLIFFFFKLISVFTVYATVSVIADNVFYLAFICGALVFWLLLCKIENSVSPRRNSFFIFPAAVVSSIVALCCFIPQLIVIFLDEKELLHTAPDTFALCAAFTIFSICYTLSLYSKKNLANRKRQTHRLKTNQTYNDLGNQFFVDDNKQNPDQTEK